MFFFFLLLIFPVLYEQINWDKVFWVVNGNKKDTQTNDSRQPDVVMICELRWFCLV